METEVKLIAVFAIMICTCFTLIMIEVMTIPTKQYEVFSGIVLLISVFVVNGEDSFIFKPTLLTFPDFFKKFFSPPYVCFADITGLGTISQKVRVVFASLKLWSIGVFRHFVFRFCSVFFSVERIFVSGLIVAFHTTKSYFRPVLFMLSYKRRAKIELVSACFANKIRTFSWPVALLAFKIPAHFCTSVLVKNLNIECGGMQENEC